eukprot:TRINITY_DN13650_c0_g1_i1.p1 TRINITY_DN13650_c0_g1~~TRINITY_DN13650_c0_g1_i1.p1  ORF type:complete len:345 (+),score=78.74 TRINITY_DN13650_c0_g1_i1:22-1056(+)
MGGVCGGGTLDRHTPKPKTDKNTMRILTLGTSGCGKTTFSKQMQILGMGGFNEHEIDNFKSVIQRNVIAGLKELALYMNAHQLEGYDHVFESSLNFFLENTVTNLDDEVVQLAKTAWAELDHLYDQVQQYMQFPHLRYFIGIIDDIVSPDYIPSNEDIVRCRQATIGASTHSFWHSKYWWDLVDVGGHSPERSKWVQIVKDGVQAMIFFVALDDYDTESGEEKGKSKFEVAQLVWEEVINSDIFAGECTMLFLNKMDTFENAIMIDEQFERFQQRFPDYDGPQEATPAIEYIRDVLLSVSRTKVPDEIYTYATCAIDKEQMEFIWGALRDNIFRIRMEITGMGV